MGGRYFITGVQLGILKASAKEHSVIELVDEILDKQFIGSAHDFRRLIRSEKKNLDKS